jgi:hypothetical protein
MCLLGFDLYVSGLFYICTLNSRGAVWSSLQRHEVTFGERYHITMTSWLPAEPWVNSMGT